MGETEIIVFIALISLTILAFVIVTVALVFQYRKRKIIYEHEKKVADELHKAELLNVKMEVQEETMQHIGIEIHDSVAQKLTLASLHLQQTEYENKFQELNHTLILSSNLINESLDDLRLLSRRLLKQAEEQIDVVYTLQTECDRVAQLKICNVNFNSDCSGISMNTAVVHTLLRIVQELIQNSLKHSGCKHICVSIQNKDMPFTLKVSDDGKGYDMENAGKSAGVGLKNIQKRAGIIDGAIEQHSEPGKGTHIKLTLLQKQHLT
jgi:signal transduction histidine kinase